MILAGSEFFVVTTNRLEFEEGIRTFEGGVDLVCEPEYILDVHIPIPNILEIITARSGSKAKAEQAVDDLRGLLPFGVECQGQIRDHQ